MGNKFVGELDEGEPLLELDGRGLWPAEDERGEIRWWCCFEMKVDLAT